MNTLNQVILSPNPSISLYIKREDLLHPFISGNKYRKLKYNLIQAGIENQSSLLTFGGAFSNHIAAVAYAGKRYGFSTIGIIRGEELTGKISENPTLKFASECGMKLEFVTRESYKKKDSEVILKNLKERFGDFYLIPEGGTNALAIKGCTEILSAEDLEFDYICCSAGTGGTAAGISKSLSANQQLLIFPALKGDFFDKVIRELTMEKNWRVMQGYDFGGYGKITTALVKFMNNFYKNTAIPLDPVYTAKMIFGVMDLIAKDFFPQGSKILAIHTGGLQGIDGMNIALKKKNLPLIQLND